MDVEQIFFHCAKAFLRSQLWDPETWDADGVVPRRAVLAHQLEKPDQSVAELDAYYGVSYLKGLYEQR